MTGYALHSWTCNVILTFMHNVIMFLKETVLQRGKIKILLWEVVALFTESK